jgi:hypothetical protein
MTQSSQRRSEKMTKIINRLRDRRQTERGDFLRPRRVPLDAWRRAVKAYGVVGAMQRAEAGLL